MRRQHVEDCRGVSSSRRFPRKEAREHAKIWPQETKLSEQYAKGISNPELVKNQIVTAGTSKPDLIFKEVTELSPEHIRDLSEVQN